MENECSFIAVIQLKLCFYTYRLKYEKKPEFYFRKFCAFTYQNNVNFRLK